MSERVSLEDDLVAHLPELRAFARGLTRDAVAADDLVQETLMKAWTNLDKFQAGTNMRAWLFTIQRNTFYTLARRRKWEVEDAEGTHAARLVQKPAQEGAVALRDFETAFAKLPSEQREALTLVGAAGMSYEEAAEICGCAVGTVKSRVNRARLRLTEELGADLTTIAA
ncbi:MAG: sigma-70 family RNA polymerase sigma factor [Pseudomonadota bacterium]